MVGFDAYTDHVDPGTSKATKRSPEFQNRLDSVNLVRMERRIRPGNYDYRRFIDGVVKHFPRSTYFMSWNDKWSLASNQHVQRIAGASVDRESRRPAARFDRQVGPVCALGPILCPVEFAAHAA